MPSPASPPPTPAPATDTRPVLHIGHSPDADDAFMWWPITAAADGRTPMDTGRFRFQSAMRDIEALNRSSQSGELEVTALSCAAYPSVCREYALTSCGASLGAGFGPRIVSARPLTVECLRRPDVVMAIPGRRTSAFAAASLMLGAGSFRVEEMPFDEVVDAVVSGRCAAGLVIHEAQLTFAHQGLHLVADLGAWWTERTGLPLPLGVNAIRRDLDEIHGPGTLAEVTAALTRSVQFALDHRRQALAHAAQFTHGVDPALTDRFVAMYVNEWSINLGPRGTQAVREFLGAMAHAGLAPALSTIDVVSPPAEPSRGPA